MNTSNPIFIVVLVLFFVGTFIMLLGIVWGSLFRRWIKTEGTIVRPDEPIRKKVPNGFKYIESKHLHFQYIVDGTTFVKQSAIEQSPLPMPGTKVKVLYHPNNPERAIINSILLNGGILRLIGGIIFSVSLIIYTIDKMM